MLKRTSLSLILCMFLLTNVHCTSDSEKEDGSAGTEQTAEGELESLDAEKPADAGGDAAATDTAALTDEGAPAAAPVGGGDALPEDSLGFEDAPGDKKDQADAPPADAGAPVGDMAAGDAPPPETPAADVPADLPPDSSTTTDITKTDAAPSDAASEAPPETPKPVAKLRKIDTTPRKENKALLNAVYLARPGDTWDALPGKILGAKAEQNLKKLNPFIAKRELKPGDKVYYNSPQRPDDSTKVLTYYEDAGVAPEIYVSKPGDNIRKVSEEVLGFKDAWKEVWSTNAAIESKDVVPAGTEIRYWKNSPAAPSQDLAQAPPPPPEAAGNMPPPPPGPGDAPPPDLNQTPPAAGTTSDMASQPPADAAPPPPPPPPPEELAAAPPPPPPPPPPVAAPKKAEGEGATIGGLDEDTLMSLGGVALVAVAGVMLVVIQKKKRRKAEEAAVFGDTHVG